MRRRAKIINFGILWYGVNALRANSVRPLRAHQYLEEYFTI